MGPTYIKKKEIYEMQIEVGRGRIEKVQANFFFFFFFLFKS